jgi:hypothetical protein
LSAALAGDAGMLATSEYLELHLFIILYGFSVLVHLEGTGVSLRERPKKITVILHSARSVLRVLKRLQALKVVAISSDWLEGWMLQQQKREQGERWG